VLALQDQDAAPLQRQLAFDARLLALEEVLHLGAEALGDHPQHADRRPRLAELYLVQKGSTEVVADDLGQAHAPLVADSLDALA